MNMQENLNKVLEVIKGVHGKLTEKLPAFKAEAAKAFSEVQGFVTKLYNKQHIQKQAAKNSAESTTHPTTSTPQPAEFKQQPIDSTQQPVDPAHNTEPPAPKP